MGMTPEGRVKSYVKTVLGLVGAYFFMPVQTGFGSTTVDFLCCIRGRFVGIETKATGRDMPTVRQSLVLFAIYEANGLALVVDADTMHELYQLLATWHDHDIPPSMLRWKKSDMLTRSNHDGQL